MDTLLVESLVLVGAKERTAQDLVTRLGKLRRDVLLIRLRQRGILAERREDIMLGLILRWRWPTVDCAHKVLDLEGLSGQDVRERAKQVADGDWAAKAIRDAIVATQAAMTAALVASTTASATSSC